MLDLNKMKNTLQLADGRVSTNASLTDWANEPSLLTLKQDLQMAVASHDVIVSKVRGWLALRNPGPMKKAKGAPDNRSQVQPKLVRKQAEWRYSALTEPFLSTEQAVKVSPATWEDTKAAEQNQVVLNHQFRNKMNWVKFIDEYVRTATDEGTVVLRTGWERHVVKEEKEFPQWTYYSVTTEQEMQMLTEATALKEQNPNAYLDLPEEVRESVEYSQEIGQPVVAQITGYVKAPVEKIVENKPTVDILDIENVFLDPSCNGEVEKAGFAVVSFETSKADMIKDGRYTNLDKVNWSGNAPSMAEYHHTRTDDSIAYADELRKRVVAHEYWGTYDINGDDVLVPIVATWVGDTLVRMEKNPYPDQKIPLVFVQYMPVKKSAAGEPDAELIGDNQAILGALSRGMIDLLARSANAQTGHAKGMLDAVNKRRYDQGLDYEFNPSMTPAAGVYQHKYPELPQSALAMTQLQNADAESLTGVKAFSGGMSGNAYGDVAAGIRGMLDAASKREMGILRRLADGISQVAKKFASMNAVFLSEEEVVRITNEQFIKVRREDLPGNFDIKIDIATAEVDEAKAQDLSFMLQTMGNSMDFSMTQMILTEIATLKRMPELAKRIMEFKPQPDPLQEQLKQMEIAKVQAEIEEINSRTQLNLAKARAASSEADAKDLGFLEQESGTKHARELQKQSAQAEGNIELEMTKRLLAPDENGSKIKDVSDALRLQQINKALKSAQ